MEKLKDKDYDNDVADGAIIGTAYKKRLKKKDIKPSTATKMLIKRKKGGNNAKT